MFFFISASRRHLSSQSRTQDGKHKICQQIIEEAFMSDLKRGLPRLVDQIGRGIRHHWKRGNSAAQGQLNLPYSAGTVAINHTRYLYILCKNFHSSSINSVVSIQFLHVLARCSLSLILQLPAICEGD